MGSIEIRKYQTGRVSYKVSLRKIGFPTFCITFDDLEEAANWMEKNENEYYENPDKYIAWRQEMSYKMHRNLKKTSKHIKRPLFCKKYEKPSQM